MSVLRRYGYVAKVTFHAKDKVFVGRIMGVHDLIEFQADSVDLLTKTFAITVDDYRAACQAFGRPAERSHSGKLHVRMPPKTHAMAAMAADARGMSLNGWVEETIRRGARVDLGEV